MRWWDRRPRPKLEGDDGPPLVYRTALVDLDRRRCLLDGRLFRVRLGAWMFYLPDLQIKLIHARDGLCVCFHKGAPTLTDLRSGNYQPSGDYTAEQWLAALSQPVARRAAEAWVAARKIAEAGLGPPVGKLCVVGELTYVNKEGGCSTAGFEVMDIRRLPRKPPCTEDALLRAGVAPDATRSCLRQQKRGWIMDLSSAVPVRPLDAESDVAEAEAHVLMEFDALKGSR